MLFKKKYLIFLGAATPRMGLLGRISDTFRRKSSEENNNRDTLNRDTLKREGSYSKDYYNYKELSKGSEISEFAKKVRKTAFNV